MAIQKNSCTITSFVELWSRTLGIDVLVSSFGRCVIRLDVMDRALLWQKPARPVTSKIV